MKGVRLGGKKGAYLFFAIYFSRKGEFWSKHKW